VQPDITKVKAGIVGTGLAGSLHVDALRRLGIEVVGVVGSTSERAAAKTLGPAYPSLEALLDDTAVDVVHIATPTHLHYTQARQALAAGKHVVCEKPLTTTAEQAFELFETATGARLVHCTSFNLRFYPQVHQAWSVAQSGAIGRVWDVHGCYLQDSLAVTAGRREDDGELGAIGLIGSQWLDTIEWVTGDRAVAVCADLATPLPALTWPAGWETIAVASPQPADELLQGGDFAHVLLRFGAGARGSLVLSRVAAGRKNALRFEIDTAGGAVYWNQERPDELWLGHVDRANELLLRNPALLEQEA